MADTYTTWSASSDYNEDTEQACRAYERSWGLIYTFSSMPYLRYLPIITSNRFCGYLLVYRNTLF